MFFFVTLPSATEKLLRLCKKNESFCFALYFSYLCREMCDYVRKEIKTKNDKTMTERNM